MGYGPEQIGPQRFRLSFQLSFFPGFAVTVIFQCQGTFSHNGLQEAPLIIMQGILGSVHADRTDGLIPHFQGKIFKAVLIVRPFPYLSCKNDLALQQLFHLPQGSAEDLLLAPYLLQHDIGVQQDLGPVGHFRRFPGLGPQVLRQRTRNEGHQEHDQKGRLITGLIYKKGKSRFRKQVIEQENAKQ